MTAGTTSTLPARVGAGDYFWRGIHDIGRDEGLVIALRALQQAVAPAGVPGAAGHVVFPAGTPVAGGQGEPLLSIALGADNVLVGRRTRDPDQDDSAWAIGVSWMRLGVSRWLLRQCVEHARGRTVGAESLLQQQMVIGMVADALTEQLEAEALLDGGTDPELTWLADVSSRLLAADRIALNLLGASGFAAGLLSHTAWASELLADAYIGYSDPGGRHDRA